MTIRRGRYKRRGRFRSNFERLVADQFIDAGAEWKYEIRKYQYETTSRRPIRCFNCGNDKGAVIREYLPDFFLSNGVVIEAKGRLLPADCSKLKAVRKQHPTLDLRILFQSDRKFSRTSEKRYSDFAREAGIPYAVGQVPEEWLVNSDQKFPRSAAAMERLFDGNSEENP